MSDDDNYEQTLLIIRECFVYKIPPRHTVNGYRAADWNVDSFLWTGRLLVVSKGDKCTIKLEDSKTGEVFATCPYNDTAVESVTDSSRYFVLRIEDGGGRHAFIGMGFTERSEAFDFNAALSDHNKYLKQKKEAVETTKRLESAPKLDLGLKEGQKIHVNFKIGGKSTDGGGGGGRAPRSSGSSGGGLLLPPPPGGKKIAPPPSGGASLLTGFGDSQPSQTQVASNDLFGSFSAQPAQPAQSSDPWGSFGGSQPAQPPAQQQVFGQPAQQPQSSDPWGFGSTAQPSQPQQQQNWNPFG